MSTLSPVSTASSSSLASLDALGLDAAQTPSLTGEAGLAPGTFSSESTPTATAFFGADGNVLGSGTTRDGDVFSASLIASKGDANQGSLPSTADGVFKNINSGVLGTPLGREYGKEVFLVNDRDNHRAYANIVLTKEGDGQVLRVSGKSEAIEHLQDGKSPTKIYMQEFITVRGNNDTGYTFQGGISAEGGGGSLGGGIEAENGKTWTQVAAGDVKTTVVSNRSKVTHDIDGTIIIPNDAKSVEYKLNVTFEYADGSRISRSVSARTNDI